jgi:NDP-sugar pyrophosphorylase family protein
VEVAGAPFLVHQLRLLAHHGVSRAVLCVGFRGDQIESCLGDKQYGISLDYSFDSPQLDGTLGAIRRAIPLLGEKFLVLYGDTYLRMNYRTFYANWQGSGLPGAMSVFHNSNSLAPSNAAYDGHLVTEFNKEVPDPRMEWIDYGLGGLTSEVVESVGGHQRDLSTLYAYLATRGLLFGFEVTERFYEIGTPMALDETDRFLRSHPL